MCGNPGSGSNVTKKGTNYLYGGVVSYTCVPQHVLTGGGLEKLWIRCTSQGTWNGSAPSCEREYQTLKCDYVPHSSLRDTYNAAMRLDIAYISMSQAGRLLIA